MVGSGLVAGGVLASGSSANAASTTSTTVPAAPGANGLDAPNDPPGGYRGLDQSGTVTAVGSDSVTIKTSSATTTYSVTSSSDIEKNGEATLADLSVGDAVTFSTTDSNVIDKLPAGTGSLTCHNYHQIAMRVRAHRVAPALDVVVSEAVLRVETATLFPRRLVGQLTTWCWDSSKAITA